IDCADGGSGVTSARKPSSAGVRALVLIEGSGGGMRRLRGQIPVLVVALALGFAAAASGQTVSTTTGAINGKITDTSGAIMPGVTVSISSPSMQGTRTDVTGVDGIYRFSAIPPGEYLVTYELGGFETQIREGLRVG